MSDTAKPRLLLVAALAGLADAAEALAHHLIARSWIP